jgi:hypothetical protein
MNKITEFLTKYGYEKKDDYGIENYDILIVHCLLL